MKSACSALANAGALDECSLAAWWVFGSPFNPVLAAISTSKKGSGTMSTLSVSKTMNGEGGEY